MGGKRGEEMRGGKKWNTVREERKTKERDRR